HRESCVPPSRIGRCLGGKYREALQVLRHRRDLAQRPTRWSAPATLQVRARTPKTTSRLPRAVALQPPASPEYGCRLRSRVGARFPGGFLACATTAKTADPFRARELPSPTCG